MRMRTLRNLEPRMAACDAYRIDDAEWVETPEGNYYVIELDANPDVYLEIMADGTIL